MLNQDKLVNLYRKVIDNDLLSTEDLASCGFSVSEINNLVLLKIIKKEDNSNDIYTFLDAISLYKYRIMLLQNNEELLANKCLDRCVHILSQNNKSLIAEFLNSIYIKDYSRALSVYDKLKRNKRNNFKKTNNLYLYLLNFIIDLPEKYQQILNGLNVEDFLLFYGDEDKTVFPRNKIILLALNLDFHSALNELKLFLNQKNKIATIDIIEEILLSEILKLKKEHKNPINLDEKLSKIISFLMKDEVSLALEEIPGYLKAIQKEKYEYIIVNLIKACALKNDSSYFEAIIMLSRLSLPNYEIDVNFFVFVLEKALEKCKIELAEVYTKVLKECNKLGAQVDLRVYNKRFAKVREIVQKNEQLNESNRKDEENAIKEKCKQVVLSKGINILPLCDYLKYKRITKIIKDYPDVGYLKIDDGDNRIIVIRYMPDDLDYVDVEGCLKKGKEAYDAHKYVAAIYFYKKLLQFGEPNASLFAKIGMSYLFLKRTARALEYLTVADILNKKNNDNKYNLSEILLYLKTPTQEREELERKPKIKMDEFEFIRSADNYGIDNLDEIISFIIESSMDVESASEVLFMGKEQLNLLRLIIAREYLLQGELKKAEEFLKCVESSKDKTDYVKKVYNEIQNNKTLYLKQKNSNLSMKLSLTLKPSR